MKRLLAVVVLLMLSASTAWTQMVEPQHSASKALRWSILPGGGQVYNKQAWKVPIIYAAFAGVGYAVYYNYDLMSTFKKEYLYRVDHNDSPLSNDYANYSTSNIYSLYNSYNRTFQLMIIVSAGIYALNLLDAYVFGHLFDFQIDDNLSLNLQPSLQLTPLGPQPTFGLGIRF